MRFIQFPLCLLLLKSLPSLTAGADSFNSLNKITFRAYSDSRIPTKFKTIETGNVNSVRLSGLQPGEKVTLIVHVFLEDILITDSPSLQLKNAYLAAGHHNVIIANWKRISSSPITTPTALLLYNSVVFNDAPQVGKILANFISFLVNQGGIVSGAESVHIIGLSLGAHIAGSAGRHLQQEHSMKLGRITGLDPPGALFYFISKDEKLDPTDATFVDVIHTDIIFLGTRERLGHVDYFSNGGLRESQSGCRRGGVYPKTTDLVFCGHTSSVTIFAQSLTKDFNACKCGEPGLIRISVCDPPKVGTCPFAAILGEDAALE